MIDVSGGWKANPLIAAARMIGVKIRREDALRILRGQLPLHESGSGNQQSTVPGTDREPKIAVPGTAGEPEPPSPAPRVSPAPLSVTPPLEDQERENGRARAEHGPAWILAAEVFDRGIAAGIDAHRAIERDRQVLNDEKYAADMLANPAKYGDVNSILAATDRFVAAKLSGAIYSKWIQISCAKLREVWDKDEVRVAPVAAESAVSSQVADMIRERGAK